MIRLNWYTTLNVLAGAGSRNGSRLRTLETEIIGATPLAPQCHLQMQAACRGYEGAGYPQSAGWAVQILLTWAIHGWWVSVLVRVVGGLMERLSAAEQSSEQGLAAARAGLEEQATRTRGKLDAVRCVGSTRHQQVLHTWPRVCR